MHNIVGNTSWISIVLILWGWIMKVIEFNSISAFAFIFFVIVGILAWALGREK